MKIKLIDIENMLSGMKNTLDGIGSRLETPRGKRAMNLKLLVYQYKVSTLKHSKKKTEKKISRAS